MRILLVITAILLAASRSLTAQLGDELGSQDYWVQSFYPKLFYTADDGLTMGGFFGFIQPTRFDDFGGPTSYRAAVTANAQISTEGSRFLRLEFRAPDFVPGWRFLLRGEGRRWGHDNYYGIGMGATFEEDNVTDAQPNFYEARHDRHSMRAEVQRRIVGPLRVLAGVDLQHWVISPLEGPSVFANDLAANVDPTMGMGTVEVVGRMGLVFDSRDSEVAPTSGAMLQALAAGADADLAGDVSYSRLTLSAQGHVPATSDLTLSGRIAAQLMGGTPRFGSYYRLDGSEYQLHAMGGASTHRAIPDNRFLGRHALLGNVEARYNLYGYPTAYMLSLVAFLDAGRVFENEDFSLTTDDLQVGGGMGLFAQLGLFAVLGVTAGLGPDGVVLNAHTRWPF